MFFDSHTHINYDGYTEEERMALISVIERSNVDAVMDVAVDLVSSVLTVSHVKKLPWCYGAVGYHPHEAKDMGDDELAMIKGLARKDKIMAIGEIGLDFFYDHSERPVQREVFRKQIRLANELKMPIIIHSREADKETMDILKEEGAFSDERKSWFPERPVPDGPEWKGAEKDARVLLHCFSGSRETARQYVKLGATISVAGPVTYKNNKKTVGVVNDIPIDFLLVETDAPFLAPEPLRGKRNVSPYIIHTAGKVGEIKGLTLEETAEITKKNAMRFFGIDAL
ncbi:MAG: TatD family hydrolase [Firmicutes bacterium]|nr:TatD family hydrolase [Bacillota bacterium]MBQ1400744.1 TatD family hydrolase [Bacillota bacterium]